MEKSAVFQGGYGRIGEILHGRMRPEWDYRVLFIFVFKMTKLRAV